MALSSLFVEIGGSIGGLRTAMGEAVREIKGVEKASGETATGLERSSKIGATAAVALGAGFIAAAGESVKMAADFETSNNTLVSTAGESADVLKNTVGPGLLKLAGDVGYSAQELSHGMYTVESGGFHAQQGLDLMRAAAQGAKAENADLGTVTNALTTVMQDYKGKLDDPTVAMSKLVAITGSGKMTFQDLAGSLSSVLPLASSLNIGLGQVGGAVATMTQHGESADLATQHLNHTIDKLNSATPAMVRSMDQYGVSAKDVALNLGDDKRGLAGTVGLLEQAIRTKMGPSGQIAIDTLKKSQQAATDAKKEIAGMPPALQKASQAFLDGTMGAKEYTKTYSKLGAEGSSMGEHFKALAKQSKGFNDALASGRPDVVNFAGALKSLTGDQTTADTLLQLMGKNYDEYSANVKTADAATKDANGQVKGFADTQETLNFKLDSAKASVGAFAISLGNALLPAAKSVADVLQAGAHWMAEHAGAATALAVVIGVVLAGAMAAFVLKSMKGLADVATGLTKGIAGFATWVARRLFGYSTVATAAEVEAGAENGSMIKRSSGLVVNVAKGAWWVIQKIGHFIAVSAAATFHAGIAVAKWLWEVTTSVASATAEGAKWVAIKVGQYTAIAAGAVAQAAIASAAWVAENIVAIAATGGIILVIGLLVMAVLWLIDHWSDVKRVAGEVWGWVEKRFQDAANWIGDRITDILGFMGWLGTLPGKAAEWFGGVYNGIVSWIGRAIDWLRELPGKILGAVGNLGSILYNAGRDIVIGLWNGIAGMGNWLWNTIVGWIKSVIPGPIAAALGIHSPSKVAHDLATHVPEGLAGGMIANAAVVTDASKHLAAQAVSAFGGAGSGSAGSLALDAAASGGYALSAAAVSGAAPLGGSGPGLGTATGGAAASGPVTVINVQGSIVDPQGLYDAVQKQTLRTNGRNPVNGLSVTRV